MVTSNSLTIATLDPRRLLPAHTPRQPLVDTIHCVDTFRLLRSMADNSVNCVVTSPPYYGLRSYLPEEHANKKMEIGLEPTPELYIQHLVELFREVRRVLRDDGVVWLNLGDSYWGGKGQSGHGGKDHQQMRSDLGLSFSSAQAHVGGHGKTRPTDKRHHIFKPKDAMLMPHRVAIALQEDGWYIRMDNVWSKTNGLPESVQDRPTRNHEYVFLLTKSQKYWYDAEAIKTPVKEVSLERQKRGRGSQTKNTNGAPGQYPQSLLQFKPNENKTETITAATVPDGKQSALGDHRLVGFNDRYENAENQTANQRSTWLVPGDDNPLLRYIASRLDPDLLDQLLRDFAEDCQNATSVIRVNPEQLKYAHFAAFPRALVEPMILVGCPAKVCAYCGTPYTRITTKHWKPDPTRPQSMRAWDLFLEAGLSAAHLRAIQAVGITDTERSAASSLGAGLNLPSQIALAAEAKQKLGGYYREFLHGASKHVTLEPACECHMQGAGRPARSRPGLVLDPFMGSGTVAVVAKANRRNYIGAELNPDYVNIAKERLRDPLEQHYIEPPSKPLDDLPLFQIAAGQIGTERPVVERPAVEQAAAVEV